MCNDKKWPSDNYLSSISYIYFFIASQLTLRHIHFDFLVLHTMKRIYVCTYRIWFSCKYKNIFKFYILCRSSIQNALNPPFFLSLFFSSSKICFEAQKFMYCNGLHNNTESKKYTLNFRVDCTSGFQSY